MSQEKLLYESELTESSPNAPETIEPGTGQSDIAQQVPKARLARNVISQSLPYMIGFVQQLKTPSGFVFGFKDRKETQITHPGFPYAEQQPPSANTTGNAPGTPADPANIQYASRTKIPADPMTTADAPDLEGNTSIPTVTPANDEDPLIIRRLVETDVREVIFDLTNETVQDIITLFKNDFPNTLKTFIQNGGELYGFPESDTDTGLANFFLSQMMSKATQKINTDFLSWLDPVSKNLGTVDIPTLDEMPKIFTAIGEMRESLSENTNKSGSIFILCTPKIANYIAGTLGMTNSNGSNALEIGKPNQNPHLNGFIGQFGDVKVYQYRGTRPDTDESIIMGFDGDNGPNTASIYYHPYKEYLIQGGDNYNTGHSNVFYRVRDTWTTNPLDVFDGTQTSPIQDPGNDLPSMNGTSKYVVKANFTITETAIVP